MPADLEKLKDMLKNPSLINRPLDPLNQETSFNAKVGTLSKDLV